MQQLTIEWSQAKQQAQEIQEERTQAQEEAAKDFLSQNHEMTDGRDLSYFMEETGRDLNWLITNGQNIAPNIKAAVYAGLEIDEIQGIEPEHYQQEREDFEDPDLYF